MADRNTSTTLASTRRVVLFQYSVSIFFYKGFIVPEYRSGRGFAATRVPANAVGEVVNFPKLYCNNVYGLILLARKV
jgi:hypothetical protein